MLIVQFAQSAAAAPASGALQAYQCANYKHASAQSTD